MNSPVRWRRVLSNRSNLYWRSSLRRLGRVLNYGLTPFERDWDVLIVLDACRADLFEEFAPRHASSEQFETMETVYSCASSTEEYIEKSFTDESALAETAYVTANGFSDDLDPVSFDHLEEVWRYAHDTDLGTVEPEAVTNAAIGVYRDHRPERMIVHYVQPHSPFLHCPGRYDSDGDGRTGNVWDGLNNGRFDREAVWEDYGQNLRRVLDHVETVAENTEGKVVVTSDHGNTLGEWGTYGHRAYYPVPAMKRVPWVTLTGAGRETYTVDPYGVTDDGETEVEQQLRDLGYLS